MPGRRVLHAALFVALVLAIGGFTRPARAAAAPFCDDRGATAVAPPPALQASDVVVAAYRACSRGLGDPSPVSTVSPARSRVASSWHACDAALASILAAPAAPASGGVDWAAAPAPRGRGIRDRLDRPPRR